MKAYETSTYTPEYPLDSLCNHGYSGEVVLLDNEEGEIGRWRGWKDGGADQARWLLGGVPLLGEARVHQLRGSCRPDRDHAPGAGGEEALGLGGPVLEDAELLHAPAGSRGPAGGDLHRLAAARDVGWCRGGLVLRDPVDLRVVVLELSCGRPLRRPGDHGPALRRPARRNSDRGRGGLTHRQADAQPRRTRGLRGSRLRGPLLPLRPVPAGRSGCRGRRPDPEPRDAPRLPGRRARFFGGGGGDCPRPGRVERSALHAAQPEAPRDLPRALGGTSGGHLPVARWGRRAGEGGAVLHGGGVRHLRRG